jgi:3-methyl-2-oxobutanoate hydroxymethyltransferase
VSAAVERVVDCGIPVMGHIGMTPQSVHQFGGFKVQGKALEDAKAIMDDAEALEKAGVFSIVLESIPHRLAELITERCSVPTIGIGAGPKCDGEIQVIHDILGSFTDFVPRHTRQYIKLDEIIGKAVSDYASDVKTGNFPTEKNSFSIDEDIIAQLRDR